MARTTASWEASSGRRVQPTEEDEVEDDEKEELQEGEINVSIERIGTP